MAFWRGKYLYMPSGLVADLLWKPCPVRMINEHKNRFCLQNRTNQNVMNFYKNVDIKVP